MQFNPLIPELSVTDIERTRKFYIDMLGFKIEYERPENLFMFVSKDNCQLMLEQVNGNWNVGDLIYPFGRGINLEMTVSDVDALYQRRETDSVIIQKQFLIQDPDGYLLRFTD